METSGYRETPCCNKTETDGVEFNRFDVSAKELIWDDPAAWLDRMGIGTPGPVTVVDSDITTLTAAADKVIRVLMGLRFSNDFAYHLLEGVHNMQESTTYQAILNEGRNEGLVEGRNEGLIKGRVTEAQRLLLMLGETRFGEPDVATRGAIEATLDLERLERLTKRVVDMNVQDWNGLVSTA
jgi:hypothetical protein